MEKHPKYLGEEEVDIKSNPYANYDKSDWAMEYIERYGQTDGSHHKQWVMDQVARILNGTPVIVKLAKWDDGQYEYRINTGKPSQKYKTWVENMKGAYDEELEEYEYSYDEGVAP